MKIKFLSCTVFLLYLVLSSFSTAMDLSDTWEWVKILESSNTPPDARLAVLPDEGILVISENEGEIRIVNYKSDGELVWKTETSDFGQCKLLQAQFNPANETLVVLIERKNRSNTNHESNFSSIFLKFDKMGNLLQNIPLNDTQDDFPEGGQQNIKVAAFCSQDQNYIVSYSYEPDQDSISRVDILQLDNRFKKITSTSLSCEGFLQINDLISDTSNSIYFCGSFSSKLIAENDTLNTTHYHDTNLFYGKLDSGKISWIKQAGSRGVIRFDEFQNESAVKLLLLPDGNLLIGGEIEGASYFEGKQHARSLQTDYFYAIITPEGRLVTLKIEPLKYHQNLLEMTHDPFSGTHSFLVNEIADEGSEILLDLSVPSLYIYSPENEMIFSQRMNIIADKVHIDDLKPLNGGLIVAGTYKNGGIFGNQIFANSGNYDLFIAKADIMPFILRVRPKSDKQRENIE
ncbi:hypothetical protein K8I28_03320 [bacterium]|nr:hypothetical protein [bacterium]